MCTITRPTPTPVDSKSSFFDISFPPATFHSQREVMAASRALGSPSTSRPTSSAGASSFQMAREVDPAQTPRPVIRITQFLIGGFLRELYSPDANLFPTPKLEQEHPLLTQLRELGRKYQDILSDLERGISLHQQLDLVRAASMPSEFPSESNIRSAAACSVSRSPAKYGLDGHLGADVSETFSEKDSEEDLQTDEEFLALVQELTSRGKDIDEIATDLDAGLSLEDQIKILREGEFFR